MKSTQAIIIATYGTGMTGGPFRSFSQISITPPNPQTPKANQNLTPLPHRQYQRTCSNPRLPRTTTRPPIAVHDRRPAFALAETRAR